MMLEASVVLSQPARSRGYHPRPAKRPSNRGRQATGDLWRKDGSVCKMLPRGSIYTTIMELGPQNHNGDGLLGPNSIIVQ